MGDFPIFGFCFRDLPIRVKIDKTIPKYNIFDEAVIQFVEAVSKASFYS